MDVGANVERHSVNDLAAAAVERIRSSEPVQLAPGEPVRFEITVDDDHVGQVVFNAHRCVTLLACCEVVARLAAGTPVTDAARLTPTDVLHALQRVAPSKTDRAAVAIAAFHAGLVAALVEVTSPSEAPTRSVS